MLKCLDALFGALFGQGIFGAPRFLSGVFLQASGFFARLDFSATTNKYERFHLLDGNLVCLCSLTIQRTSVCHVFDTADNDVGGNRGWKSRLKS
jgi:hypothetical protein